MTDNAPGVPDTPETLTPTPPSLEVLTTELQAAFSRLHSRLDTQGDQLQRLLAVPETPQHQPAPATAPPRTQDDHIYSATPDPSRRKPLPKGKPFNGDKALFAAWHLVMSHRLEADREFIGGWKDQWVYIYQDLEPGVQEKVATFFEHGAQVQYEPGRFLAYLATLFTDSHREEIAQTELEQMEQGPTETFSSFYVRFEQKLAQAGGIGWDDGIKLTRLRRALSTQMRKLVLGRSVPRDNYSEAVSIYRSVAVDLEAYQLEERFRNKRLSRLHPTQGRTDSEGDTPMTEVNTTQTTRSNQQAPTTNPSWNTASRGQGKNQNDKATRGTRQSRRTAGACYRCGSLDHLMRECPKRGQDQSSVHVMSPQDALKEEHRESQGNEAPPS